MAEPEPSLPVDYEVVIQPNRSWLRIDWRGLVEFRDLLWLLVRRDFVSKYKQTLLGPAWFVLQPLFMTVVFTLMFDRVAKISTDGNPAGLFYLCGLLAWNYCAQNVSAASATFTNNAGLFSKVYFPRLIVPLSIAVSNLAAFALQFVTFMGFYLVYKMSPAGATFGLNGWIFLLPALVVQIAALSLGVSLWMSSLTARYRDLIHLMQFLIQVWMFASFVIVPLSSVPAKWQWLAQANPMATVVEAFRLALLGSGTISLSAVVSSVVLTVVILLTGILVFQRTERTFIDTV